MATLRNKRKLAALNKENCEDHPRSNLTQYSNVPRSHEDYVTQVSEEIEDRVTKKLRQEFSRAEDRILGALSRLDDFLMNPLIQGHSGTTPGRPETHMAQTRERMKTTPRGILILQQASFRGRRRKTLARNMAMTVSSKKWKHASFLKEAFPKKKKLRKQISEDLLKKHEFENELLNGYGEKVSQKVSLRHKRGGASAKAFAQK